VSLAYGIVCEQNIKTVLNSSVYNSVFFVSVPKTLRLSENCFSLKMCVTYNIGS
jgi:hypothetical protein